MQQPRLIPLHLHFVPILFFVGIDIFIEKWFTMERRLASLFFHQRFFDIVPMQNSTPGPHYVSQLTVAPFHTAASTRPEPVSDLCFLMREMISAQDRQNELLEELIGQVGHPRKQRTLELALWKRSNPELAEYCRRAATTLERVQTDLLASIVEEVDSNADLLLDSEFGLSEFIDRFGPKFMQLNGLFQVLAQLGNAPEIKIVHQEVNGHDAETSA